MGRKTTWKSLYIANEGHLHRLETVLRGSIKTEFGQYTTVIEMGSSYVETNMPHSLLRDWFSFAGVPLPSDFVTADKPYWADSTLKDFEDDRKIWNEYGVPPILETTHEE